MLVTHCSAFGVLCGLLLGFAVLSEAQSPQVNAFTGTWKLNLAKSQFHPGPPFQSFTLTFTPDGTRHLDLVSAGGQPFKAALPWSDGHPVTVAVLEGAMENLTAVSKISGKTFKDVWREKGKVIERVHGAVSADGKTLTIMVEGPLRGGGAFHNRVVFDRQ